MRKSLISISLSCLCCLTAYAQAPAGSMDSPTEDKQSNELIKNPSFEDEAKPIRNRRFGPNGEGELFGGRLPAGTIPGWIPANSEGAASKMETTAEKLLADTYKGFDPRSTESYIIFELIRSHDIEKSIHCAEAIQKKMVGRSKLSNRGVSNAGFLVLHQTAMPSILIELGFITNSVEENFLASSSGQQALTKGIFEGFSTYYKQYGVSQTASGKPLKTNKQTAAAAVKPAQSATTAAKPSNASSDAVPIFKIQILTSDKKLAAKDKRLKGLNADFYKEKGLYKYTYGASSDYNEIVSMRKKISSKFKEAFIIAFRSGVKIDTQEAIKEFKQTKKQK